MEKHLNPGHNTGPENGPELQCEAWWPAMADGCHVMEAHQVAWPGRRGCPQCARGHHGRSRRGGTSGHGSPMARLVQGRG
jgi:hypothetical protein